MQTQFIWQYCYALCRNVQGSAYLIQIGCQGIVTHYGFFCSWQSVHDIEQTKSWSTRFRTQWDSPWPKMLIIFFYFFIFSASRRNTRAKHHHSRNIADKGGESCFFQSCRRLCLAFAVQSMGHWRQKNLHAHRRDKKKKKVLRVPDIDSFRYMDSRQGGCHLYRGLFLVPVWRCCQSFSPEVSLWCEWIMRCRSEWVALKRTR